MGKKENLKNAKEAVVEFEVIEKVVKRLIENNLYIL